MFPFIQSLACKQIIFIADSNNNCNYITHENCCNGCGPQEQFYGCADVSIERATVVGLPDFTVQPTKPVTYTPPPNHNLANGFIPIGVDGMSFVPPQSTLSTCRATDLGRNIYGINEADQMCQKLCVPSSHCPVIWCESSCRNTKRIVTIV